ncbi:MAG TPA: hypothetical protein VJY85_09785 [Candidatus Limnocylindria bacterium]|nr:hypothetical protein [Candidatus Limnocylindria bacterium]
MNIPTADPLRSLAGDNHALATVLRSMLHHLADTSDNELMRQIAKAALAGECDLRALVTTDVLREHVQQQFGRLRALSGHIGHNEFHRQGILVAETIDAARTNRAHLDGF